MTPEGILTEDELPFDSELGQKVVRKLQCYETYQFYRAQERQLPIAQASQERKRFGDGAEMTLSMDPVLMMRLYNDPRFGPDCFGEEEFVKDMRKWAPEVCAKTQHRTQHFALGGLVKGSPEKKDDQYLVNL